MLKVGIILGLSIDALVPAFHFVFFLLLKPSEQNQVKSKRVKGISMERCGMKDRGNKPKK